MLLESTIFDQGLRLTPFTCYALSLKENLLAHRLDMRTPFMVSIYDDFLDRDCPWFNSFPLDGLWGGCTCLMTLRVEITKDVFHC